MLTDDELKDIQWAAMSKVGNASKNLSAAISAGLRAVAEAAVKDAVGGEPVAWARNLTDPRPDTVTDLTYCSVAEHERGDTSRYIPLYTRPQAIAAIPEKKTGPIARTLEGYGYVNGWNACIDAMIGNRPEVKNAE